MSLFKSHTTAVSPFRRRSLAALLLATSLFPVACNDSNDDDEKPPYADLDARLESRLFEDLTKFVAVPTYRSGQLTEPQVVANIAQLRDELNRQAEEFNQGQKVHKLVPFEWKKVVNGQEYWLFGLRLGTGPKKILLSSHLDTVPPGDATTWEPFTLKREQRMYLGKETEFYVGRGTIDDKGPALVAFYVLQEVARRYDGNSKLDNISMELIFDTSEETDMSMPHYLNDNPDRKPELGVVYDAYWCVRAEKGIERPEFTIKRNPNAPAPQGLWIESLDTLPGPANQISDTATAVIRGSTPELLQNFAAQVQSLYSQHPFDDPSYRRSVMTIDTQTIPGALTLVTLVSGAQHGSVPQQNRQEGSNPLISLAAFLGDLAEQGKLARNELSEMTRFISWAWGTQVQGEHHPALLQRTDDVFSEGNGTTYALTRFESSVSGEISARLRIDIRYALGHHSQPWDGKTEGYVGGDGSLSIFPQVLAELLQRFPASPGYEFAFTTRTLYAPDVRLPEGRTFSRVSAAYQQAMGEPCPAIASGFATDAKGNTDMLAAGALFTTSIGPPINYHGINEGAPVVDLQRGSHILYDLFVKEIETP